MNQIQRYPNNSSYEIKIKATLLHGFGAKSVAFRGRFVGQCYLLLDNSHDTRFH